MRGHLRSLCCSFLGLLFTSLAWCQDYPNKPVRLVVPFAPGGIVDYIARLIQPSLIQVLGQGVVVDNRPGAGGMTANEQSTKANADGYTLLINANNFIIIPVLEGQLPYKMVPVTILCISDLVLTVNPKVAASNVQDLVAVIKSQSRKLNYSSAGIGTTPFMAAELFKLSIRQDIIHIPYKGAGPAVTALLGGEVEMSFTSVSAVAGFVKDGRLRAMATTGDRRSNALPNVPTFVESGMPEVVVHQWNGIFLPSGTPRGIVRYLNASFGRTLDNPNVKAGLERISASPIGNTPEDAVAFIDRELVKWTHVVKEGNIKGRIAQ